MTEATRSLSSRLASVALAAGLALAGIIAGAAVTPAKAFTGGTFPSCSEPGVLTYIAKRFVWTDEHVIRRGLRIEAIFDPRTNRVQYETEKNTIGRLYCHGTALMNDGRKRTIWYMIEEGMGFASIRDNVEFCVAGLDPWKVHGAWCRSVR